MWLQAPYVECRTIHSLECRTIHSLDASNEYMAMDFYDGQQQWHYVVIRFYEDNNDECKYATFHVSRNWQSITNKIHFSAICSGSGNYFLISILWPFQYPTSG